MEVSQYLKLHYRAIVTETGWRRNKTDGGDSVEITDEATPLTQDKGAETHWRGKIYSTKGAGKTRYPPKKES